MKREYLIKFVALFEIVFGLSGLSQALGALFGLIPYGVLPMTLYGIFPLISLVAGVLLWVKWKHATILSLILLMFQIPFAKTDDFLMNLGVPLNLTISGIWLSQHGGGPTHLGLNFLAIAVFIVLQWYDATAKRTPVKIEKSAEVENSPEV